MRYPADHKAQTRQRVLREAAAAIRTAGVDGIGIAAIMAKAGLTQGGFYAHFKSKEDLLAQAVTQMFDEIYERHLRRHEKSDPVAALTRIVDIYLDTGHRDSPQRACPMPTLAGELARLDPEARRRFAEGAARVARFMAFHLEVLGHRNPTATARSVLAEMVGAVALSRVIEDPEASAQFLDDSRTAVRIRLGLETPSP